MDIQALKPVSGVSFSPEPTGGQVREVPRPDIQTGRDLSQTLEVIADQMRSYLRTNTRNLEFRIDVDADVAVIIVRDAAGAIIRQIPGEEALRVQRRMNEGSSTFLDLFV